MLREPFTCSPTAIVSRLLSGSVVVVLARTSDHVAERSAAGGVGIGGSCLHGPGHGRAVGVPASGGVDVVVAVVRL